MSSAAVNAGSGTFPVLIRFNGAPLTLHLPHQTTFHQLHVIVCKQFQVSKKQAVIQDSDRHSFPGTETVFQWKDQLPDGTLYLISTGNGSSGSASKRAPSPKKKQAIPIAPFASPKASQQHNEPDLSLHLSPIGHSSVQNSPTSSHATGLMNAEQARWSGRKGASSSSSGGRDAAPSPTGAPGSTKNKQPTRSPSASPIHKPASSPSNSGASSSSAAAAASATPTPAQPSPIAFSPTAAALPAFSHLPVSVEATLWRIFSHYSMFGPLGHPDALTSQMFFKLLLDCGLASKNQLGTNLAAKKKEHDHSAEKQQQPKLSPAIAELFGVPASKGAEEESKENSSINKTVHAAHLPHAPNTPLRRSDVDVIYINSLKSNYAAGFIAASSSEPVSGPASTTSAIHATIAAGNAITNNNSKMCFEVFIHALLHVAMLYYGDPQKKIVYPPQSSLWDVELYRDLLEKLLFNHVLPLAQRWNEDAQEIRYGLLQTDQALGNVLNHFEGVLASIFRMYTTSASEGAASKHAHLLTPSISTPDSNVTSSFMSSSSAATSSSSSSSSSGYNRLLSYPQWQSMCTDFKMNRLMLTPQDLSRSFVQSTYERIRRNAQQALDTRGSRSSSALFDTGSTFAYNALRLSMSQGEFVECIARCALISMSKLQLYSCPPSIRLKAFFAHMHHTLGAIGNQPGQNAQINPRAAAVSFLRAHSSAPTNLVKVIAKLREKYLQMWEEDGRCNYFDPNLLSAKDANKKGKDAAAAAAKKSSSAGKDEEKQQIKSPSSRKSKSPSRSPLSPAMSSPKSAKSAKPSSTPASPTNAATSTAPLDRSPLRAAHLKSPSRETVNTVSEWKGVMIRDAAFHTLSGFIVKRSDPDHPTLEIEIKRRKREAVVKAAAAAAAATQAQAQASALIAAAAATQRMMLSPSPSSPMITTPAPNSKRPASAAASGTTPAVNLTNGSVTSRKSVGITTPTTAAAPAPAEPEKASFDHLLLFPKRKDKLMTLLSPVPPPKSTEEKVKANSLAEQFKKEKKRLKEQRTKQPLSGRKAPPSTAATQERAARFENMLQSLNSSTATAASHKGPVRSSSNKSKSASSSKKKKKSSASSFDAHSPTSIRSNPWDDTNTSTASFDQVQQPYKMQITSPEPQPLPVQATKKDPSPPLTPTFESPSTSLTDSFDLNLEATPAPAPAPARPVEVARPPKPASPPPTVITQRASNEIRVPLVVTKRASQPTSPPAAQPAAQPPKPVVEATSAPIPVSAQISAKPASPVVNTAPVSAPAPALAAPISPIAGPASSGDPLAIDDDEDDLFGLFGQSNSTDVSSSTVAAAAVEVDEKETPRSSRATDRTENPRRSGSSPPRDTPRESVEPPPVGRRSGSSPPRDTPRESIEPPPPGRRSGSSPPRASPREEPTKAEPQPVAATVAPTPAATSKPVVDDEFDRNYDDDDSLFDDDPAEAREEAARLARAEEARQAQAQLAREEAARFEAEKQARAEEQAAREREAAKLLFQSKLSPTKVKNEALSDLERLDREIAEAQAAQTPAKPAPHAAEFSRALIGKHADASAQQPVAANGDDEFPDIASVEHAELERKISAGRPTTPSRAQSLKNLQSAPPPPEILMSVGLQDREEQARIDRTRNEAVSQGRVLRNLQSTDAPPPEEERIVLPSEMRSTPSASNIKKDRSRSQSRSRRRTPAVEEIKEEGEDEAADSPKQFTATNQARMQPQQPHQLQQQQQQQAQERSYDEEGFDEIPSAQYGNDPAIEAAARVAEEAARQEAVVQAKKAKEESDRLAREAARKAEQDRKRAEIAAEEAAANQSRLLREAENLEKARVVDVVQRGDTFTKYTPGVFGVKSEKKFVRVSSHGNKLFWGRDASSLTKSIVLRDISEIRAGNTTKAFAKLNAPQVECALTIVTAAKQLDLVAANKKQKDDWLLYLRQFVI